MPCTPGMRRCRLDCRHRRMVEEYRLARHAAELAREAATGSYPAEVAEYGALLDFKTWLQQLAAPSEAA